MGNNVREINHLLQSPGRVIFSLHPPGGEYKERKGGIKMEDYIDFPCSDLWLGYYHDKGLTPRNPQEDYLMKKIERLERQNKQLFYLVAERLQKESKEIKQITDKKIKALERF